MPQPRPPCGKWMPRAKTSCVMPAAHYGRCMTAEAVRKRTEAWVKYGTSRKLRHRKRIDEYKLSKGCIDCGYNDHPVALDFDHRDPELKTHGIAVMMTYSWVKIVAELDKCDVRCANCHRVRTSNQHFTRRKPGSDNNVRTGLS